MILRSLKLENIRSYTEEKINFPKGSVLLSGDIGSGKSTILLAIEFALFGILRSGLSGMSLLKHGTNKGSVELKFEIDKKEYLIKRTLKKTKTSVGQDSGYILSDGKKFEGTPVELKAKIIEILGYPEELITKSKSLIYRFTVYTAQEEMKEILFEDKDLRLDTLRKVFGIDKYKSIKENAIIFAREIKRNKSELAIRLESYDVLSEELHEKREKSKLSQDIKSKKENELDNIREIVEKEKSKLKEHEVSIKRYNEIKKNLEIKKTLTETKKNSITELTNKSREIKIKIKNLEKKLLEFSNVTELKPEKELEEYLSKIQDKYSNIIKEKFSIKEKKRIFEEQIKEIESDIKELSLKSKESILIKDKIEKLNDSIKKKSEQEAMLNELFEKDKKAHLALQKQELGIKNSEKLIKEIETAETCPTCKRELNEKHRNEVIEKEETMIKQNNIERKRITGIIERINGNIEKLRKNIDKITELEYVRNGLKEKLATLESVSSQIVKKQKEVSRLYEKKKELEVMNFGDESIIKHDLENKKKELSAVRDNNLRFRERKNILELEKQEKENLSSINLNIEKNNNEIEIALIEIKNLENSIASYSEISVIYEKQKEKLEETLEKQKMIEINLASLSQELKSLTENIENFEKKLKDMDKIKLKIKELGQILEWFDTFFLNLMSNMEKHIMVSIHREFNSLVKEWFSILIDDIDIDLDEEFSVKITQDGYETTVEGLSGGEKTSVALAYRLALNKVINDLIPRIKTKDLIILDEPTDGFSTEQLDKVRDVLRALNMKQTIIVSHEPKMESFVDNIIRISKIDNISKVIS